MYRNIINGMLVIHGCIHKLEKDCPVLNEELGDCEIECENKIVWRCPYFHIRIKNI